MVPLRRDCRADLRHCLAAADARVSLPADTGLYIVATLAIILVGLAKGGFAGLGATAMPLLALVMDPVRAAAMLLPILLVQDVVSVWAFRRSFDGQTLAWMVPGALLGVFLGWLLAASVDSNAVRALVGVIAVSFGGYRLSGFTVRTTRPPPQWLAAFWGMVSGFTSQVAHSGGPPFQVWALTRNFPHTVFIGTSSIFFAVVNRIKVPAYVALGQFTWENMRLTALLMPLAIASTFAGVWIVKRIRPERFYGVINVLMVALGLTLLWDSVG
jgi:uncharacterized protein